ncbi:winged helix-turn-helix domain-containing protein [Microbacterium sp. SL75]|uniref:winged helix-turn-helix domain-containing protein n=1 Tax=Microbacterium sp. SL75 TaxID=2995140 RepID=UPI0022705BDE|nr:crosslink repair DNA glycosylase YcaQ family protein [Microbacterium sp. SL75]WAC68382.1 winged helix DNA-binding domain-containing protein [Microbacterium sp. SL75]
MTTTLRRADARRIALAAQGFARPRPDTVGTRQITGALQRMRILQIDSVNVFSRSHYMPLFARLGPYDPALLDKLAFSRRPKWVESWAHVASLVSVDDWPLLQFRRDELRAKYERDAWAEANQPLLRWLRDELADRGPLRPAEIEHDARSGSRGSWWGWDDVKNGLERLWLFGDVAIAGRRGFERRYALVSDVLPPAALETSVPRAEAIRELVRRAAIAYGVATAADLADYWRIRDRPAVMAGIRDLVDAGELIPVSVEGWQVAGPPAKAWLHRDAARPRKVDAAAILTPFDPVVWFRDRAERLFDFDYRIEIYTPAPQRRFGYYSLPVLVGDDIVGRIDLKADRASRALRVQSAWWERGAPSNAAERLAAELLTAARWQGLDRVTVSRWGDAAEDLAGALRAERHEHPDGRVN